MISDAPAPSQLGYVVIGGYRFPVTGLHLAESSVVVTFVMRGPLPAFRGNVTVFGEDGTGCWQGSVAEFPEVPRGGVWAAHYRLITDVIRERPLPWSFR